MVWIRPPGQNAGTYKGREITMKTLREALADWQDPDGAMYELARVLGLLPDAPHWDGRKDLFWTNNPVANLLYKQLGQLAELGVLEFDEDETRFRWNPSFALPS